MAALLVVASATNALSQDLALPDMGDASQASLSGIDERRLGEAFMRRARQSLKIVDDPEITDYLQSLGQRLASNAGGLDGGQGGPFTFFVVEDPSINAFAAPGGFIGVHSGLMLATRSESELAAVLAHEIAHVTQRHIARTIEAAQRMTLPAAAAMLAAMILGSRAGQLGQAAMAVTAAGQLQRQINFTRANEQEADWVGMQILARGRFDPRSMPAFFERLQQANRFAGERLPEFLSTHPVSETRIAESRARAEQYPQQDPASSLQYYLMNAKQRVLSTNNPAQAAQYFKQALKQGTHSSRQVSQYGYALALLEQDKHDEARALARSLLAEDATRIPYLIVAARVELESGNVQEALKAFAKALELYSGNQALTLYYAQALLQAGQARKARQLLQEHIRERDFPVPEFYQWLARAQGDEGLQVEGHESMAEYYFLMGQSHLAMEQLQLALRLSGSDFYRTSRVEARLKELESEASLEKTDSKR
jgi:predicted Zn-dependent protease